MSEKSTNRKINIWINGKQVTNTFKGINSAMRQARNELANMTIGSKAYEKQTKKLKELQGILDDHRTKQGLIATGWKKITSNIKQIAVGNFISEGLTKVVDLFKTGFQKIITSIGDFEGGMTNVFTLMSDNQVEQFSESLKNGSKEVAEMGFKMKDTNKSLFDAISAGVDAGDSIDYLKEAAILAKGGVTKLSTAVDGNTSVMNAYNLAVSEAGNINAAFFSAQKEGKTTVEELANSVGKVAPIAANVGVSYQELLSATAALTKKGISTSESMTYLKATFSNLLKPSTEAEKILRKFGVPVGATEVKAVGLTGVLEKLNEVIQQNPDAIAKAIPSTEALTAVQALSGEGMKEYQRILKNVQTDIGENSSLQKAYKKQMESFPNVMAKASAKLNNFAFSLGEKLAPYIKEIVPLISGWSKKVLELVDWILRNGQALKTFSKWVGISVVAIKSYNAGLAISIARKRFLENWTKKATLAQQLYRKALLLGALGHAKITGNIKRAAAAQRALNIAMKSNPIGLVVGLLASATAAYFAFRDSAADAADEQARVNDELERLEEIQNSNKSIDELFAGLDRLDSRQLTNFVDKAKSELDRLKDIYTEKESAFVKDMEDVNVRGIEGAKKEEYIKKIVEDEFKEITGFTTSRFKQLERFISVSSKRLDKLQKEEAKRNKLKKNNPGEDTGSSAPKTDALKEYKDAYEDLRKELLATRQKMNLAEMSEEDRAIEEIRLKYDEQLKVVSDSILHFQKKKEERGYLLDDELDLQLKFYDQQTALIELSEQEIFAKQQEFSKKKVKEKEKVQKQIKEILIDGKEKEVQEVAKKYQELIAKAKEYGIDTVELYQKMNEEISAIKKAEKENEPIFLKQKDNLFGIDVEILEKIKKGFEEISFCANEAAKGVSAFFTLQSNKEQSAFQEYETNNNKKKKSLESRLNAGRISEAKYTKEVAKLDKELEIEKKKIAIAEAKRSKKMRAFETIINTAAAVVGFLANPSGLAGAALSATAAITGGLQLAAINAEPLPQFAKGARVNKPTIAMVGEAGREIVLSNKIVDSPVYGGLADDLARIQEGKQPRILGKQPKTPNFTGMKEAIGRSVVNSVTNNTTNINQIDNKAINKVKDEISEMKESVKEMTDSIKDLKYLKAIISDDDLVERDEENKVRMKYEGF